MPQLVIDPDNIGKLGDDPPAITEIPSNVRKFGYIPNFRRCHFGDLILFRNRRPGPSCHWIRKAQSTFGDEDAQWTHAAVFLYDDLIVEAVPLHGVRPRSLCSDVPNRVLRVRRNNLQNEIDGYKIALRALSMLGASYNAATGALKFSGKARVGFGDNCVDLMLVRSDPSPRAPRLIKMQQEQ